MGFCEVVLDVTITTLKIVDDNGNVWGYIWFMTILILLISKLEVGGRE